MGRRVEKKVYTGTSGTSWTLSQDLKFVYDGYKCIEVLDGANSNVILQKFLWNGEELLSVYDVAATAIYYYFADANKNIGQLIDSSGNTVAQYEYSPFGVQTLSAGTYATSNPFRFSSEYFDTETNLVYYNYRYYSPALGRWTKRDPIGEEGGINLNEVRKNDLINYYDLLGLRKEISWDEYWKGFKSKNSHLSNKQLNWAWKQLHRGCVGITTSNLGTRVKFNNCYKTKTQAEAKKKKMKCDPGCPQIFSAHVWNDKGKNKTKPDVSFNPQTGKADLSNWDYEGRPKGNWSSSNGVNFDFGYLNPDGTLTHADMYHNPDKNNDGKGDYSNRAIREATIFISSLDEWQQSYADFNTEVWCVQCNGGTYDYGEK